MVEFNPDGSLKLPGSVIKSREESAQRMNFQKCIRIRREIVNHNAPKKCVLKVTLSNALTNSRFIENIFNDLKETASTPLKLARKGEKEIEIEVGSDFKRCSECLSLRGRYREFLYGNMIEEKGNCTYEGRARSWNDEDYFE